MTTVPKFIFDFFTIADSFIQQSVIQSKEQLKLYAI